MNSQGSTNGVPVTEEMIAARATEAEAGFDLERLRRGKRGRPPVGLQAGEQVFLWLDPALMDQVRAIADLRHISKSQVIRDAVRSWVRAP